MIFLPAIFFGICVIYSVRKYGWNVEAFLFLIYFITGIASIMLDARNLYEYNCLKVDIGFLSPLLYIFLLWICIKPFGGNNVKYAIEQVVIKNTKIIDLATVAFFLMFILNVYVAVSGFSIIVGNTTMAQLRQDSYAEKVPFYDYLQGMPRYICALTTYFFQSSFFMLVVFFVDVIYRKTKWYLSAMALIGSANQLISSVFQADRSQFVYWLVMFVLMYTFFKKSIDKVVRKEIIMYMIPVIVVGVGYLTIVTLSRWEMSDTGAEGGMILYLGQNYFNFCNYTNHFWETPHSLCELFPATYTLLWGETYWDWCEVVEKNTHIFIRNFSTFLGYICSISGPVVMILFAMIYSRVTRVFLHRKNTVVVSFWDITKFWMVALVPACGFFCYPYSFLANTIAIIVWFFIGQYSKK